MVGPQRAQPGFLSGRRLQDQPTGIPGSLRAGPEQGTSQLGVPAEVEYIARREPLPRIGKPSNAAANLMHERNEYRLHREVRPEIVHRRGPDDDPPGSDSLLDHRGVSVIEAGHDSGIAAGLQRPVLEY